VATDMAPAENGHECSFPLRSFDLSSVIEVHLLERSCPGTYIARSILMVPLHARKCEAEGECRVWARHEWLISSTQRSRSEERAPRDLSGHCSGRHSDTWCGEVSLRQEGTEPQQWRPLTLGE
jgi:hypothetical protein